MEIQLIDSQVAQQIIDTINNFALQNAWVGMAIGVFLLVHKVLVTVRDAIDKTPATDDNKFERFVTICSKIAKFLGTGARPKQNP